MEQYRKKPLQLYIQDIYRAKQSQSNKFVYEMFGIEFKNVLLHGVVTSVYNSTMRSTNFELSDATGTIQVYYKYTNSNKSITTECMTDLIHNFVNVSRFAEKDTNTMSFMLNRIEKKHEENVNFENGNFVSVIGDIFMDDFKSNRMISAYECSKSSIEQDILWMEELRYMYDKCYIK